MFFLQFYKYYYYYFLFIINLINHFVIIIPYFVLAKRQFRRINFQNKSLMINILYQITYFSFNNIHKIIHNYNLFFLIYFGVVYYKIVSYFF